MGRELLLRGADAAQRSDFLALGFGHQLGECEHDCWCIVVAICEQPAGVEWRVRESNGEAKRTRYSNRGSGGVCGLHGELARGDDEEGYEGGTDFPGTEALSLTSVGVGLFGIFDAFIFRGRH